jgi:DNA-directed RNA polymerase specialized sigma24 family protein
MPSAFIDHQHVTVLLRDHRESIVNYLLQKVRCQDTAQDLSQEAYLRLLRQDSVPHTDNLTGYLYKTAERMAIDFLRYDKRIGNYLSPLDDTLEWECPKPHPEAMIILRQQCDCC